MTRIKLKSALAIVRDVYSVPNGTPRPWRDTAAFGAWLALFLRQERLEPQQLGHRRRHLRVLVAEPLVLEPAHLLALRVHRRRRLLGRHRGRGGLGGRGGGGGGGGRRLRLRRRALLALALRAG